MTINRTLTYAIIVGLLMTLFVPFIVSTSFFFPFITGKAFAFRIITEIIFGLWIILALRDGHFRPRFSWLGAAFAVFVAVIGIADLLSPNPLKSFWSNFERMEGYVTLLHLFAYFVVASSVLQSEKWWMRFFQVSVGTSVIMSFYGMLQLAGKITINQGGVRLDGTLGNATYLAAFMLLNFFLALFLLIRSRKIVLWRWIYGIAMTLQLFILYHTATRGAVVGLFAGLTFLTLFIFLFSHHKTHRSVSAVLLGILLLLIVLGSSLKNADFVQNHPALSRLASISISEAGPRFMVWNMALQGFKESPKTMIVGWGQESFNYVFNKYYDPGMYAQEQWFDRTHNVIFDWLVAGGALGLLAYLSLFVIAPYYVWKQSDLAFSISKFTNRLLRFWSGHEIPYFLEKSVLTALLVAYFIQNVFVFDNISSYILFVAVLAYIHSISSWHVKHIHERVLDARLVNRVLVPITIVAVGFIVYATNVAPVRAAATLINSLRPYEEGPAKNLEYFKKALGLETFGNPEIREQLAQASIQALYASSLPLTIKQEFYDLARSELIKQTEQTPSDARYFLFLGSFLNRAGNTDDALLALQKAVELSQKKQTILFELGSGYINKGDYTKGLDVIKRAFDLAPNFNEARTIYAVAAVYAKDYDLAAELLKPFVGTSSEYDDRLLQAYTSAGRLDVVTGLLEKRVAHDQTEPQPRFNLAANYLARGMRTKAVEVLRTVITEFPTQKEQAEYYIREIQAGRNP